MVTHAFNRTWTSDDVALYLYDNLDDLLASKQFGLIDNLLSNLDIGSLGSHTILGLLICTRSSMRYLRKRQQFFNQAREVLARRHGNPAGMLIGLSGPVTGINYRFFAACTATLFRFLQ